jgi:hypothetical protein
MPRGTGRRWRVLEAKLLPGATRPPGPAAVPWTSSSAPDVLNVPPIRRSSPEAAPWTRKHESLANTATAVEQAASASDPRARLCGSDFRCAGRSPTARARVRHRSGNPNPSGTTAGGPAEHRRGARVSRKARPVTHPADWALYRTRFGPSAHPDANDSGTPIPIQRGIRRTGRHCSLSTIRARRPGPQVTRQRLPRFGGGGVTPCGRLTTRSVCGLTEEQPGGREPSYELAIPTTRFASSQSQ